MLELSQLLVYCTLICSFFNILSISIISWFLAISILNFYCFRGWEDCTCSLVLFTNVRCSRFTVKSDVLLQTILQCCDAIFQYSRSYSFPVKVHVLLNRTLLSPVHAREHVRMNFVSILFRNGFVYELRYSLNFLKRRIWFGCPVSLFHRRLPDYLYRRIREGEI